MAKALGQNRYEGDFGMPMLPGESLRYESGDYVRIATLELCARELNGVPGAAAELGVYRGSFARQIQTALPDRTLYLFDTFSGFAQEDLAAGRSYGLREAEHDWSGTSVSQVLDVLPRPDRAVVRAGRFPETARGLEAERFCLVSLDADLYLPTLAGLRWFWPRLSPGGYLLVHDYNNREYPGAAKAVREFGAEAGLSYTPLPDICGSVIFTK